jgi:predicted amidohydrolase
MVKLCVVQFTPAWGEKENNLHHIAELLKDIQADIIVLPELCTTGYSFLTKQEAFDAADDAAGESIKLFQSLAVQLKAMIVAGFAEKDGEHVYNSALAALPDGSMKVYRKTHLFYKEKLCFEPGNSGFFVIDHPLLDCKVGIMVCNDWRYPEAARSLALLDADVIACPCNLVSTLWGVGMPARALENKVYVAVANRCGTEKRMLDDGTEQSLTFNGGSVVYDCYGAIMVQANKTDDGIFTVEIDAVQTRDKSFNAYNDLFKDRRTQLYLLG